MFLIPTPRRLISAMQRVSRFWQVTTVLVLASLFGAVSWGALCGWPLPASDAAGWLAWRWSFLGMGLMTLAASMAGAALLVRSQPDPRRILSQLAEELARAFPTLTLTPSSGTEVAELSDLFRQVRLHLSSRVDELQSQQNRLEQGQDRLAIVLEAMVEGVIAVDADQRILLANTAAIRLLELKYDRVESHPLWESVRIPRLQEVVKAAIDGIDQQRLEFEVPRTQAVVVAVVSRLSGQPCPGAVIVLHDVTDLRRLENLRREFVSNVSHELKTPLSAISGYSETLLDGALEDPAVNRGFVTRIEEQATRLNGLILDLLELARVESDPQALEATPVEVSAILEASLLDHKNIALLKSLELRAEPPREPCWAWADPSGLRTIVDNLLDNAINYTPSGGHVTVRWWRDAGTCWIEVRDTGVGIAKEHQARIFERFFRVDRARSREVGGTGLGLSIVKHLVQVFGGEIKVISRLGQGSTFQVRLRSASSESSGSP